MHRRRFSLPGAGAGTASTKAANRAEDVGAVLKPAGGVGSGAAAAAPGASYHTSHAQSHVTRLHGGGLRTSGASAMREDAGGEPDADEDAEMGSDADVDADADIDADAEVKPDVDSGRVRMPDGDNWARANFLESLPHRHAATNDESDVDEKLDVEDDEPDTCSGLLCFPDFRSRGLLF